MYEGFMICNKTDKYSSENDEKKDWMKPFCYVQDEVVYTYTSSAKKCRATSLLHELHTVKIVWQ